MNILEPEVVWVNNRRYRFFESDCWSNEQKMTPYQEEYQTELDDLTNEACENNGISIEPIEGGKYRHRFEVSKVYNGGIIGYQGQNIRKMQQDTKTIIKIPRNSENFITITGITRGDVISARQRINLLIETARKKMRPTHFIAFPIKDDGIKKNYEELKREILNDSECKNWGIVEDMFVNPNKLHLTIGMMLLVEEREKNEAIEVLKDCVEQVVRPILKEAGGLVKMNIQGLNCMNDDPSKVTVLYGSVLANETLQEIANKVFNFFLDKGLTKIDFTNNIKLHMTLIKSSNLMKKDQKRGPSMHFFNACKILKKFEKFNFGEVCLNSVDICVRHERNPDGSYGTIGSIPL